MNKTTCLIYAPVGTYSGYGSRSRDLIKALIESRPDWEISIIACRWGNTRTTYLEDHNEVEIVSRIVSGINHQPDVFISITVPNEFQKVGKYNIGVTAGIETTLCDSTWIQGCNNMDLVLVSSEHAKKVFQESKYNVQDNRTGQVTGVIELQTKMEVLFEGVDTTKYLPVVSKLDLDNVEDSWCYLVVGHWLPGEIGEDRKNIGYTIKAFLETFKNKPANKRPALLLKVQAGAGTSIMDREILLDKIDSIRKTVKGDLPNVYVLHGEMTDTEINELYNHPKVKAMVSLTKGEGYGRPLLEFSLVNKPIIASAWSGHVDFLDKEFVTFVGGTLTPVHPSAAVEKMLLRESMWFTPDSNEVGRAFKNVYDNYGKLMENAKRQGHKSRTNYSYSNMRDLVKTLLETNIPEFPKQVQLKLPQLKKVELPKLKKID